MTDRIATTDDEIQHINNLLVELFTAVVKVTLNDGTKIIGMPLLHKQFHHPGISAHATITKIDGSKIDVDLLGIATVENALLDHQSEFVAAGLLDLKADPKIH